MNKRNKTWWWLAPLLSLTACETIDAGGVAKTEQAPPDDPLNIEEELDPESFDALHRDIIQPSCASTEAFCHHGQFEPNLSTPALAYNSLVRRPGIELFDRHRVEPGDPDSSLLIDKLRGRAGVATVMPLGAPPMSDDDIARLEKWIEDGALRHPDADEAPVLNEPPHPPEIAVFDQNGDPLGSGTALVAVGQSITLRHSVKDFETPDASIPYGAFILQTGDGRNVVIDATYPDGTTPTVFDAAGPMGVGDELNWRLDWTVPDMLTVTDGVNTEMIPAAGTALLVIAIYLDGVPQTGGILSFDFVLNGLTIDGGGS